MRNIVLAFIILGLGIMGCVQPPEYPIEPQIKFISFSKDVIHQSNDSTRILISFTDGDGDLGLSDQSSEINVYLEDTRDGFVNNFKIPFIPQQGVGNGISGEICILLVPPICCITPAGTPCLPTPQYPENELIYTLQIEDRAGNRSNKLSLPPLTLLCQ